MQDVTNDRRCSFCDKGQEEVSRLIVSPTKSGTCICNECVELCNNILADLNEQNAARQSVEEVGRDA